MITTIKNIIISGHNSEPIAADVFYNDDKRAKPVVIYSHGFNGFKDWGNFDMIAKQFAEQDFVFVKFNFSHNGTSPEQPEDFTRLDLFGENNYTKELYDLHEVIEYVTEKTTAEAFQIDTSNVYLIGHSMGGGISIVCAAEDKRVKKLVTWASVKELKTPWTNWNEEKMNEWKESGVAYYHNGRTKQDMPLHYQLYTDWKHNEERLNIDKALQQLQIPMLICHGTKDEAVNVSAAHHLQTMKPDAALFLTESDHVFGRKHPWPEEKLPEDMRSVVDKTISFLKNA